MMLDADATFWVETAQRVVPFLGRPVGSRSLVRESRNMTRAFVSTLAACLTAAVFNPAEAAGNKVRVPDQFDGSWTITAVTKDGPCAASTSYRVQIKGGDASIPDPEVTIDGGVSKRGSVQATITKGASRAPINGNLSRKGSGSGTWRTSGGLVECSGSWSARRAG
ncbi:heme utilization protein [Methylobacterium sp. NEAU 140]|uniref:heme utilization protein n=1 Tax=Methylobacterium sp. NEAU 140 TaxID=3064945 RepID=UPI0027349847|nr:heme utilization protein [Methylobacterium sp. NEAU 140]MDP4026118.1 heme utilization protein [Methylobacterium sp. NEAU 140]